MKWFELGLVILTFASGLVWLLDRLFFAKARRARAGLLDEDREPVVVDYARAFFPILAVVLVLRSFVAEPFRIPSSSMMPTLLIGDFILVNKFAYGLKVPVLDYKFIEIGEPERGEIVVFRYPVDTRQDYIKRIVGLPGDEVVYRGKKLFINGQQVDADPAGRYVGTGSGADMTGALVLEETLGDVPHQILQRPESFRRGDGEGSWKVPEGHYFVMGDNRDNSLDSRYWEFVPEKNLVGRAFLIWMNWDSRNGGVDFSRIGTVIH